MIRYIDEEKDLKGKRVILRLDLNVPIVDGVVADDFRIQKIINTVDFLRRHDCKTIILSHIEDAEGNPTTLLPVFDYLNGYFKTDFCPSYFTPEAIDKVLKMEDKGVLLFENVRNNAGEIENDPEFAKKLAQMGDIYVNDAFAVSHRPHASIVGIPEYLPHCGGLLLREEIENLSKVFSPEHPFVFILGGAKFETKLPLIKKYLDIADTVFVGGALANDVFRAKGLEVGVSKVSDVSDLEEILKNPKLKIPADVTVENGEFKSPEEVSPEDRIVDVGPNTIDELKEILKNAKTILWNGPLGQYEAGFGDKTEQLAEAIAKQKVTTIIGGGDTLAAIATLNLLDSFSFVSTGGGAMLDFLLNQTLPGIEALEK